MDGDTVDGHARASRAAAPAAAAVATGVLLVLIVQQLVSTAGSLLLYGLQSAGALVTMLLLWVPSTGLPFATGIFLVLWLVAPLRRSHPLAQVVVRGLVASVAGGVLVLIAHTMFAVARGFELSGSLFGARFPARYDASVVVNELGVAVQAAVSTWVGAVPLVVLAVVLHWLWRRGRREPMPGTGYA